MTFSRVLTLVRDAAIRAEEAADRIEKALEDIKQREEALGASVRAQIEAEVPRIVETARRRGALRLR